MISDANHNVIETPHEVYHSEYQEVAFKAKFGLDGPGSSVGNLNLGYTPYWSPAFQRDTRLLTTGERRNRLNIQNKAGYTADINGDYEFALGPGRLKAIGVRHCEHAPLVVTDVLTFDSTRRRSDRHAVQPRCAICRNDRARRISLEERPERLAILARARVQLARSDRRPVSAQSAAPVRRQVPFPEGTGKVTEVRYEGIATLSRPLTANLDLQVAAGAETSRSTGVDDDEPARKFFRPKGSLTLAWRPAKDWDVSLKLRRRVGQIDFLDFLVAAAAQPGPRECRQSGARAAAELGGGNRDSPMTSAAGARPGSIFIIIGSRTSST